ncbi:uroporphyrinogen decarboxylase family protein [Holophaga foetida]|uniref:uroporphyrinogen decarboxylase family protein n=1 Tax=Holophaga foetida TaxID=35839 RepID=UPI0002474254|nr:uroporphyrinogen decarboxylase family protein [Holophaga foetida]
MSTGMQRFGESMNRIKTAVELGTPDRPPVVLQMSAFAARHLGVKLADFCASPALSNETIIKSALSLGDVDGVTLMMMNPKVLSLESMCAVETPGIELGEDDMWQVHETERMQPEDYDAIIQMGFAPFMMGQYIPKHFGNLMASLGPMFGFAPTAGKNTVEAGLVPFAPLAAITPFQTFMGGRSMVKFNRDLFRMPEKIMAAMDVAQKDVLANVRKLIGMAHPFAIMTPIGRASGEFYSRKVQEKFIFPHYKELVETVVECGAYAALHVDDNFERDLDFFRTLPKGKCIFQADSSTNIFKLKEALGDHMCIMGDVPATMLALGTPDEVHTYATRLVREIGPSGFILSSGCDVPPNAKVENVKALVEAAKG